MMDAPTISAVPKIKVKSLPPFQILYHLPPGTNTVILIGGRGGAKTYEISKFVAVQSTIKKKRCVVLRDEKSLVRESILNEILLRFDTANANGMLGTMFERLDSGLKDKQTNSMVVFSKGFRASDLSKTANLKSISDIDFAVIEEAEDIREVDKFNTFSDSIRKEGSVIIIILNTPDINHWIVRRYFNLVVVEDGYWKLEPKKLPGFVCIQTGFNDNPFLPTHVRDRYNSYGDPSSHMYNPHYYRTQILGLASSGRKGQVHKKVKPIKLDDYMKLPFKEYYGQDFGTAAPAGLVGVKIDGNNCYCRQINYLPMNTLEIAKLYHQLNLGPADKIIADNADKTAIDKLKIGYTQKELSPEDYIAYPRLGRGFFIEGAAKGKDSLDFGISLMDSLNLYAVEESVDLWDEIHNRVYAKDKNENFTNEPEPGWDHLLDGWMYVITWFYGKIRKPSNFRNQIGYLR